MGKTLEKIMGIAGNFAGAAVLAWALCTSPAAAQEAHPEKPAAEAREEARLPELPEKFGTIMEIHWLPEQGAGSSAADSKRVVKK